MYSLSAEISESISVSEKIKELIYLNDHFENKPFHYTYCAKEQEEVRRIRSKYLPKEENKLDLLRRLDANVLQKATMYAIIAGVTGALIFGVGLYFCIVSSHLLFIAGILISIIGMAILAVAYPVYNRTVQKERARIAPEILRLSEDLMK